LELERAISAEKQGIARAHRLGLQHPLNVIRFYTRQTLEEAVVHDRKIALPDAAAIIVAEERKRTLIESDNEGDGDDDYISDAYEESLNLDEPSEGISEIEDE
jgi:SNF2 family DNA or RNA helicase